MTRTLRLLISSIILLSVVLGVFYLSIKTLGLIKKDEFRAPTVIFSHDFFYGSGTSIEKCIDDDRFTAWVSPISLPWKNQQSPVARSPIPPTDMPYLQMELAITHFPGNPPLKNQPERIVLWSGGDKKSGFKQYARPRKIRLVVFDQEVVDVDREYRIPDLPDYLTEKTIILRDTPEAQVINLDFISPPEDSPAFPKNIRQLWVRMEFLSFYPAVKGDGSESFAIREIDYESPIPDHPQLRTEQKP